MKTILPFLLVTVLFSSCFDLNPGQQITYRVGGGQIDVQYELPNGTIKDTAIVNSWSIEFRAHSGDHVYVRAISKEDIPFAIETFRDGKHWNTISGEKITDTIQVNDKVPLFN